MALKQFSINGENISGVHNANRGDCIELVGLSDLNIRISIRSGGSDKCAKLFGPGACPIKVGAQLVIVNDAPFDRYVLEALRFGSVPGAQGDWTTIGSTGELNVGSGPADDPYHGHGSK